MTGNKSKPNPGNHGDIRDDEYVPLEGGTSFSNLIGKLLQKLLQEFPDQVRERGSPFQWDVFIIANVPVVARVRFTFIPSHV